VDSWDTASHRLLSSWSGQHRPAGERFALIPPPSFISRIPKVSRFPVHRRSLDEDSGKGGGAATWHHLLRCSESNPASLMHLVMRIHGADRSCSLTATGIGRGGAGQARWYTASAAFLPASPLQHCSRPASHSFPIRYRSTGGGARSVTGSMSSNPRTEWFRPKLTPNGDSDCSAGRRMCHSISGPVRRLAASSSHASSCDVGIMMSGL
jgi:hypothetical protein